MVPTPNNGTAAEPAYDPDSATPQPESALRSLIDTVERQTAELELTSFSQADAVALGQLLLELGTRRKLPIAIDIRKSRHILFHVSLPGATPDNDNWIKRKSRTAWRYGVPSLLVGLRGRLGGGTIEGNAWFDQSRFAAHGGAFPVIVRETGCVAVVTVSGLPQQDDHNLVVEALRVFQGRV
jgi:uncharacterized protein (UPF0303 family)